MICMGFTSSAPVGARVKESYDEAKLREVPGVAPAEPAGDLVGSLRAKMPNRSDGYPFELGVTTELVETEVGARMLPPRLLPTIVQAAIASCVAFAQALAARYMRSASARSKFSSITASKSPAS